MPRFRFRNPRVKRALQLGVSILLALTLVWSARRSIFVGAAAILVEDDPLAPAQIIVPSHSMSQETALEAALLYEQQVSAHIVMTDWIEDPVAENIRKLGIRPLDTTQLNKYILERSNVPSSAITILPDRADGTGSEIAAIAAFAQRCQLRSILVITARSHTARTKWLLQRKLPRAVRVFVRSPRFDRLAVDTWWHERDQSREIVTEYLRWFNTVLLQDLWARSPAVQDQPAVPDCGGVTATRDVGDGL